MSQQSHPVISVVITTHNRPSLLARSIASVRAQDMADVEILVCADESSAATGLAAINALGPRDAFLSLPRYRGPAQTRNIGANLSRGQWVCFLDDDDSYAPGYFSQALPLLQQAENAVHYFDYQRITEQRTDQATQEMTRTRVATGMYRVEQLMVGNFIPNNACFVPALLAKSHAFDAQLQSHEDWEYLIGLSHKTNFVHHALDGALVHADDQLSRNTGAQQSRNIVYDYLSIYRKWPSRSPEVRAARHQVMASLGVAIGPEYL